MRDHEVAKLVNDLRDVAIQYHDSQQLRERIAALVRPTACADKGLPTRCVRKTVPPAPEASAIEWARADTEALAKFNPATKICTMNCGPHRDDPRTAAERKLLCDECLAPGEPHV